VVRAVLVRTRIAICLELVGRCEVSRHSTVESTSGTLAALCVREVTLCFVATSFSVTPSKLTLVDHPHILPFVSISSSRLLSDDGCALIWLILGGARVLVSNELVGTSEVSVNTAVETTRCTDTVLVLEGALELVSRILRVFLGYPLLINPDVFSFVSVCCPRLLSDHSFSLIRLVFVWARVIVVFWFVRSSKVSRFVRIESTGFDLTVDVLESVSVRVRTNRRLMRIFFVFEVRFSRSNRSIGSSGLFSDNSYCLIRLVLIGTGVIEVLRVIRGCEVSRLVSIEGTSFNLSVNILKSVAMCVRTNWRLVRIPFILKVNISGPSVSVSRSWLFSNHSLCLVRLVFIWTRVIVVLRLEWSSKVS